VSINLLLVPMNLGKISNIILAFDTYLISKISPSILRHVVLDSSSHINISAPMCFMPKLINIFLNQIFKIINSTFKPYAAHKFRHENIISLSVTVALDIILCKLISMFIGVLKKFFGNKKSA
jgi:hypothetical protein